MEPNFQDHEYLIIDELNYRFTEPIRGQVIVFRYPRNPQEYFIKRIIGLPGEEVQIKNGQVIVFNNEYKDGLILKEDYLPDDLITSHSNELKIAVGPNEYFVLGDNRQSSRDSRDFGPVAKSYVIGKVLLRGWPFSRATFFGQSYWPQYN